MTWRTVAWMPSAEEQLAEIWLNSDFLQNLLTPIGATSENSARTSLFGNQIKP